MLGWPSQPLRRRHRREAVGWTASFPREILRKQLHRRLQLLLSLKGRKFCQADVHSGSWTPAEVRQNHRLRQVQSRYCERIRPVEVLSGSIQGPKVLFLEDRGAGSSLWLSVEGQPQIKGWLRPVERPHLWQVPPEAEGGLDQSTGIYQEFDHEKARKRKKTEGVCRNSDWRGSEACHYPGLGLLICRGSRWRKW